ncbi:DUF3918 domain-containing protein [Metabacillus indicus]|nr:MULTISPECIES: DUF3918 domain-containing protein [Metabacillus]MDX8289945.1 DUF3918 domain-containing protein [Metabacillus indicus]
MNRRMTSMLTDLLGRVSVSKRDMKKMKKRIKKLF